jgi:predicted Rossmann-fold nucleotide-binding protein
LNVAGYYNKLLDFLDYAVQEGFIKTQYRGLIMVADEPECLLDGFAAMLDKAASSAA